MFWFDILIAFVFALALAGLLGGLAGWRYPNSTSFWPGAFFLFLILFFFMWAGGAWITPVDAAVDAWYAFDFLIVGLFVALLLAAIVPSRRRSSSVVVVDEETAEEASAGALAIGLVFWLMILGLLIAIIAAYL